jgi:class 3 adenylate cyclase
VKSTGDGSLAAFSNPGEALRAALEAQRVFGGPGWDGLVPLSVRMAVHTGTATERDGDYFGPALNRAARLVAIGHGGQVLVSNAAASLVGDDLRDGECRTRDFDPA